MTIPTTETVIKRVSRLLPDGTYVVARVGLQKLDRNREAYWTATAEVYEPRGKRSGRERLHRNPDLDSDMAGQCHDMILRAFPKLAPIVALHLSSPDGVPMHAAENGCYHIEQGNPNAAARLWRCEVDDLPSIERLHEDVEAFIAAQMPRWRREAETAWKTLGEID